MLRGHKPVPKKGTMQLFVIYYKSCKPKIISNLRSLFFRITIWSSKKDWGKGCQGKGALLKGGAALRGLKTCQQASFGRYLREEVFPQVLMSPAQRPQSNATTSERLPLEGRCSWLCLRRWIFPLLRQACSRPYFPSISIDARRS